MKKGCLSFLLRMRRCSQTSQPALATLARENEIIVDMKWFLCYTANGIKIRCAVSQLNRLWKRLVYNGKAAMQRVLKGKPGGVEKTRHSLLFKGEKQWTLA